MALLLIGLVVGGAIGGYLLVAGQRSPTADSSSTPSATASASTAAVDGAEEDLRARVPSSIRDRCVATEDPTERIGTAASLRCDLELTAEVETVWYDSFDTLQGLSNALNAIILRERLPREECSSSVSRAQGNWQVGSTHSGRLLCYQADGETWIVWTYDADRIAARAMRPGEEADDWLAAFEWWDQIRLFLR